MASHQYNNKLTQIFIVISMLIFSMAFWDVVFEFFMLAVKIEFLLFGKMLFVYIGGKLFEI